MLDDALFSEMPSVQDIKSRLRDLTHQSAARPRPSSYSSNLYTTSFAYVEIPRLRHAVWVCTPSTEGLHVLTTCRCPPFRPSPQRFVSPSPLLMCATSMHRHYLSASPPRDSAGSACCFARPTPLPAQRVAQTVRQPNVLQHRRDATPPSPPYVYLCQRPTLSHVMLTR